MSDLKGEDRNIEDKETENKDNNTNKKDLYGLRAYRIGPFTLLQLMGLLALLGILVAVFV